MKEIEAHCIESFNPICEGCEQLHGITILYEIGEGIPYVKAGDTITIQMLIHEE